MSEKPQWNLIKKNEATGKWDRLGAAWDRDNGGFSISMEIDGNKFKCLMVENKPFKPKTETKPVTGGMIDDEITF